MIRNEKLAWRVKFEQSHGTVFPPVSGACVPFPDTVPHHGLTAFVPSAIIFGIPPLAFRGNLAVVNSLHSTNFSGMTPSVSFYKNLILLSFLNAPEWDCIGPRQREELDMKAEDGEFW